MLTILDEKTNTRKGKPSIININLDGRISFTVNAVKKLGLQHGQKLAFAFDATDLGIVYFFLSPTGLPLNEVETKSKENIKRLYIYSRPFATRILNFMHCKNKSTFTITGKTVELENKTMWFFQKRCW